MKKHILLSLMLISCIAPLCAERHHRATTELYIKRMTGDRRTGYQMIHVPVQGPTTAGGGTTLAEVKQLIQEKYNIPATDQKFFYHGKQLNDSSHVVYAQPGDVNLLSLGQQDAIQLTSNALQEEMVTE